MPSSFAKVCETLGFRRSVLRHDFLYHPDTRFKHDDYSEPSCAPAGTIDEGIKGARALDGNDGPLGDLLRCRRGRSSSVVVLVLFHFSFPSSSTACRNRSAVCFCLLPLNCAGNIYSKKYELHSCAGIYLHRSDVYWELRTEDRPNLLRQPQVQLLKLHRHAGIHPDP